MTKNTNQTSQNAKRKAKQNAQNIMLLQNVQVN
jgi:hypothetical protein